MLSLFDGYIVWSGYTWRQRILWIIWKLRRSHSCGKKHRYPSRKSADIARKAMDTKRFPKEFDVYRCWWCHEWHVGHKIYATREEFETRLSLPGYPR